MTTTSVKIGDFETSDAAALGQLVYDAVHQGAAAFYTAEQRQAWMPHVPSGPKWAARLSAQSPVVARQQGQPVGFMTLDDTGYIDLAFVSPAHQRQGIGGRLWSRIETRARRARLERLHTQASYLARGLFERHGWVLVREQQIDRSGVTLTNFLMEKHLDYGDQPPRMPGS